MPTGTASEHRPKQAETALSRGDERAGSGGGSVRVVQRVMRILKRLSNHPTGLTLTELSRDVDLHKATVLRFLKTLEQGGFVASGGGKAWRVGPAFLDVCAQAIGRNEIRDVARPFMEDASRQTNEIVQLAILAEQGVVYIEKVEPPDPPLRINSRIGSRRPIHCTALGKVLAAFHDSIEVERMIQSAGLQRATPQTITSPAEFREELTRTRRRGYAIDDREFNELVVCAAAPVRDAAGRVAAGLSISTFGISVDSARFGDLVDAAVETAARVSFALGWRPADEEMEGKTSSS